MKKLIWTKPVWENRPKLRIWVTLALFLVIGFLAWAGTGTPAASGQVIVVVLCFLLIMLPLDCIKHTIKVEEEYKEYRERDRKWDEEYERTHMEGNNGV